jgi:SAM-dependent methyltransferase
MTREEFVLFVITLVATAFVALGVGFGPWRRRDRDLDRLSSLGDLAASPLLDENARSQLTRRLREGVDEFLIADQFKRALRVQQSIYLMCSLGWLALLWVARDASTWQQILATVAAIVLMLFAFGISNVPPQQWAMPRWLQSHPRPGVVKAPMAPMALEAVAALRLHIGDKVLILGCDLLELAAIRAAVGDSGELVAIDHDPQRRGWAENIAVRRGWKNVLVGEDMSVCVNDAFDAAVAIDQVLKQQNLPVLLAAICQAVRPGGGIFVVGCRSRRSALTPADLLILVQSVFEVVQVYWWRRRWGISIIARRRGGR